MAQNPRGRGLLIAPRYLLNLLRAVAVVLAAIHTTVAVMNQSMNEDGINYLDMGDAYLDGNRAAAINSTWSPVYGFLIASAVRIAQPSAVWEFPTVQIANFGIFIIALISFEYFWRRLTDRYYQAGSDTDARISPSLWLALGYSLFIWSSLDLVQLWSVTPDLCVSAVVFLVAGRVLAHSAAPTGASLAGLGLLLGFGYLVKAALLPLGIVALVLAALTSKWTFWKSARNLSVSLAAMLVVASPLIAALSWSAGQLTVGDVGRFTYLKHVNEMPYPDFHDATDRLRGSPENPPRRISDEPPVYEFGQPVAGTYPMAYDPGYWTARLEPVIDVRSQSRALITSAMFFFEFFVREQGAFVALVLLLGSMSALRNQREQGFDGTAALILWAVAAFGMYSVVHTLPRYIAPFVVLFWAGILARIRLSGDAAGKKLVTIGAVLLTFFIWVNLAALNLDGLRRVTGFTPLSEQASQTGHVNGLPSANHPAIAEELLRMGLQGGDRIGFIGYSYTEYWARLARLKIVAEIHSADAAQFWGAAPARQSAAMEAFAGTGAVAVVAAPIEAMEQSQGWQPVGDSGYLVYRLR